MLDRKGRVGQRARIYQTLPKNLSLMLTQPHTIVLATPSPSTPHLCCSHLFQECGWAELIQHQPRDSRRIQWKHSPNQFIPNKKYIWSPILHPSGTELPLVFTSQEGDVVNSRNSKKPLFVLLPFTSKGKRNRFSGILPFVPDYMINLASALKPIITLLSFEFHLCHTFAAI